MPDPASSSGGAILESHHYSDREPWSCLEGRKQSDYDLHWECRDTNKPAASNAPVGNKVPSAGNVSPEDSTPLNSTAPLESGAPLEDGVQCGCYARAEGGDPTLSSSVPFEGPGSSVRRSGSDGNDGSWDSDAPSDGSVLSADGLRLQINGPSQSTSNSLQGSVPEGDRYAPVEGDVASVIDGERTESTVVPEESHRPPAGDSGPSQQINVSSRMNQVPCIDGSVPTSDSNTPPKGSNMAHASNKDGASVATSHGRPLDERAVWITQTLRAGRHHNLLKPSDVGIARMETIQSSVGRLGNRFGEQSAKVSANLPSKRHGEGSAGQYTEILARNVAAQSAKQSTEHFLDPSTVKSSKEPTEALNKSPGHRGDPGTRSPGNVLKHGGIRPRGRRSVSRGSKSAFSKVPEIEGEDRVGVKARTKGSGARVDKRVRVTTYDLVIQAYKDALLEVGVSPSRALLSLLYFLFTRQGCVQHLSLPLLFFLEIVCLNQMQR